MKKADTGLRPAMLAITMVVCVLFGALLYKGQGLQEKIQQNEAVEQQLNEQIEAERERTDEIRELKDYYSSEEYIRKAAQERLGLIEEGQIVFRRQN